MVGVAEVAGGVVEEGGVGADQRVRRWLVVRAGCGGGGGGGGGGRDGGGEGGLETLWVPSDDEAL